MKIVSCIKQVYDLDIVLENDWVVDNETKSVDIHYANKIINSYDEASLELMLQLKDKEPNIKTRALTIGEKHTESILQKALAIGVDEVLRIDVSTDRIRSPYDNAQLIYESVKNDKTIELILCGKQSDINNYGQTGQILAEKLGWSCFTNVYEVDLIDSHYHLSRLLKEGIEKVITKAPLVITSIPSPDKFLRMATLREMIKAKKTNIPVISNEFALHQLSKLDKHYHSKGISIEKPVKECIFLESKDDNPVSFQINNLITKYRGTGEVL